MQASISRVTLSHKFGAVCLAVLAFTLMNLLLVRSLLQNVHGAADTVNVAGRLRMLSQRIGFDAMRAVHRVGPTRPQLEATMREFEAGITALERGGSSDGREVKPLPLRLAQPLSSVKADWHEFRAYVREVLENAENGGDFTLEMQFVASYAGHLVTTLDAIVADLAAAAAEAERRTMLAVHGLAAANALLLTFAFLAAHRRLVTPLRRLVGLSRAFAEGAPARRAVVASDDEVGQLSVAFNQAMDRIENDIAARRRTEEQMEHQATHDALTGLPNRGLLTDRLQQALAYAQRDVRKLGVLFVDLDHFKFINDSLGHAAGDRLVQAAAQRLTQALRDGDTVARVGGDEFVALVFGPQREECVVKAMQRIIDEMAEPFLIDGHELYSGCSIGAALYPRDGTDAATLLRNADAAMYRAKEQGRNTFRFYTDELHARAGERLRMERLLRRALENGELLLHYQPQVGLRTGRIAGAEALVRWQHPELGMIAPMKFIPLAEETGLINPIGQWVLTTACAQGRAWLDAGLPKLRIAVNLSARQFRQPTLVADVQQALEANGLPGSALELELTESMLLEDPEATILTLIELNALGVRLSLDDFGTGYSSLSYLKRFPIHGLKIDQSFVHDLAREGGDAAIAASIVSLAHSLKLRVTAEGVETVEQLAFLHAHGCDEIQGYHFSPPLPPGELEALLRRDRRLELPAPAPCMEFT